MDKIHVRFSISQPCLTDAVIVILNGLLSYEHPSNRRGDFSTLYSKGENSGRYKESTAQTGGAVAVPTKNPLDKRLPVRV